VNEIREINSYGISPNPVFDHTTATMTLTSIQPFPATMMLSDASGQILTRQNIMITTGISEHPVQTTDLPVGIYFVILHSDNGRLVERLVILD
jgi:hypothetical protein